MQKVIVKKAELLEKVRSNREEHLVEYEQAVKSMRKEIRSYHDEQINRIANNEDFDTHYSFPEPENHKKDYDQVIAMLEMSTEEEIELSNHEFAQYVMDEWGWKDQFKIINSTYLKS